MSLIKVNFGLAALYFFFRRLLRGFDYPLRCISDAEKAIYAHNQPNYLLNLKFENSSRLKSFWPRNLGTGDSFSVSVKLEALAKKTV